MDAALGGNTAASDDATTPRFDPDRERTVSAARIGDHWSLEP